MAAEQGRARGKASAAMATRVQNALIDGSLCGILERLDEDPAFHRLVADGKDIAPIITVGAPDGLRPAIAAAQAEHTPVVLVVASSREAEDTVNALRSWYDGDPNDIAQLEAWETLPHERLSPLLATGKETGFPWRAAWPYSAGSRTPATPIRCSDRSAYSSCRCVR